MSANRRILSHHSDASEFGHEREVKEIVEGLIAKRGYYSVIADLLTTIGQLAEISSTDRLNRSKAREFRIWARAVQAAIERHIEESTFEQRVTYPDMLRARGMSIRLD